MLDVVRPTWVSEEGCGNGRGEAYLADMLTLAVEKRTDGGASAPALRRAGSLPGVVYGAHQKATSVTVSAITFGKVLREAGEATIVSLTGLGEAIPTLIHGAGLNPLTNPPLFVVFFSFFF